MPVDHILQIHKLLSDGAQVCTDTRKISRGCVFFALKGENFNGNKFISDAIDKGAIACISDEEVADKRTDNIISVKDVLKFLQDLAQFHRRQFSIPVLAITGSNGKTTTKELVAAVLAKKYKTLFTEGNLNNHIGVPLTLLKITSEHEFAVIEMGANHCGEIELLCKIAEPDHVLITNIGKAHLEGFGGIEGVKKGKGEMYAYAKANEMKVFINEDDETLVSMLGSYQHIIPYGSIRSNVNGSAKAISSGIQLQINFSGKSVQFNSSLTGTYNLFNVLAASCIGLTFEVPVESICEAIENYIPSNHRSQIIHHNEMTIVADTYNANPSSMAVAINSFSETYSLPRTMFLGEMKELGPESPSEHEKVAKLALETGSEVIFVGNSFNDFAGKSKWFKDSKTAAEHISETNLKGNSILIKGSRGTGMEIITNTLVQ